MTNYKKGDFWIVEIRGEIRVGEVMEGGSGRPEIETRLQTTNGFVVYPFSDKQDPTFRAVRKLDIPALLDRTDERCEATVDNIAEALWIARGGDAEAWRHFSAQYRGEKPRNDLLGNMATCWRDAGAVADLIKPAPPAPAVPEILRDLLANLANAADAIAAMNNPNRVVGAIQDGGPAREVDTNFSRAMNGMADVALAIANNGSAVAGALMGMLANKSADMPPTLDAHVRADVMTMIHQQIKDEKIALVIIDPLSSHLEAPPHVRGCEMLHNMADVVIEVAGREARVTKSRNGADRAGPPTPRTEDRPWHNIVSVKPEFGVTVEVRDFITGDEMPYLARAILNDIMGVQWYSYPANVQVYPVQWRAVMEGPVFEGRFATDATDADIAKRLREVRAKVFPDGDPDQPGGGDPKKAALQDLADAMRLPGEVLHLGKDEAQEREALIQSQADLIEALQKYNSTLRRRLRS